MNSDRGTLTEFRLGTNDIIKVLIWDGHEYLLWNDGIIHSRSCKECLKRTANDSMGREMKDD
jgi:hypothetical protein